MRIDSVVGYKSSRVCISIDDELFNAFANFRKKRLDLMHKLFKQKINHGEIKNSADAKMFIYSEMMKPSAFKCFSSAVPAQTDIEDF